METTKESERYLIQITSEHHRLKRIEFAAETLVQMFDRLGVKNCEEVEALREALRRGQRP